MLPRRRKKQRRSARGECPAHLQWIRGHECTIGDAECYGKIEAAHVRNGSDGGMSKKPSDRYALPLCAEHHRLQHQRGEKSFWGMYGKDPLKIAQALFWRSPHRAKME